MNERKKNKLGNLQTRNVRAIMALAFTAYGAAAFQLLQQQVSVDIGSAVTTSQYVRHA